MAAAAQQDAFFAGLSSARWPASAPASASASAASDAKRPTPSKPKLRSACDLCHAAKVKCSGEAVCERCRSQELPCSYSYAMRVGKPKGSRNRKTLEKQARLRQQYAAAAASSRTTTTPRNDWHDGLQAVEPDLPSPWWGVDCAGMDSAGMMDVGCLSGAYDGSGGGGADQPSPGPPPGAIVPAANGFAGVDPLLLADNVPAPTPPLDSFQWLWNDGEVPDETVNSNGGSAPAAPLQDLDLSNSCNCFDAQTANLSALHSLHRSLQQQPSASPDSCCRIDVCVCVRRINAALTSCRDFLCCSRCRKDSSAVLLVVASFQLVLRLFEHLVVAQEQQQQQQRQKDAGGGAVLGSPPHSDERRSSAAAASFPPCRIGEYEVSREEYTAIRTVLVRRALHRGEETLATLKSLTERHPSTASTTTSEAVSSSPSCSSSSSLPLSPSSDYFASPGPFVSPLSSSLSPSLVSRPSAAGGDEEGEEVGGKGDEGGCREIPGWSDLSRADVVYLRRIVCRSEAVLELYIRHVSRDLYII